MAGDWLKWTKALPGKTEVRSMAAQLGLPRHHVAGLLMEVWGWFEDNLIIDESSESKEYYDMPGAVQIKTDGHLIIDSVAEVKGFAKAMSNVGWLMVSENSLIMPNFYRHNHYPSRQRALGALRSSRYRHARSVTVVTPDASLEKRREENRTEQKNTEEKTGLFSSSSNSETQMRAQEGWSENELPPTQNRSRSKPPEDFVRFWTAYPRKIGKAATLKQWLTLAPSPELVATLMAALEQQKQSELWKRENGKYILYPERWLKFARWEDEIIQEAPKHVGDDERILSEMRRRREETQKGLSNGS